MRCAGLSAAVDARKRQLAVLSACLLAMVPWMQVRCLQHIRPMSLAACAYVPLEGGVHVPHGGVASSTSSATLDCDIFGLQAAAMMLLMLLLVTTSAC